MQMVKTKFGQMILVSSMPWRTVLQNVAAAVVSLVVLSWLRLRPLGLFFLALFFFWLYKTRCSFEITLTAESKRKLNILKSKIMNTKQISPTLHFVCFTMSLVSVAIVEYYMFGLFVPIALIFSVLLISLVRNFVEIKKVLRSETEFKMWWTTGRNSDDSTSDTNGNNDADIENDDDDELLPETNDINLAILEKASEITAPTEELEDEEHSDDMPSEILIPDSIPEINENSTDEDDELIPVIPVQKSSTTAEPLAIASKIYFKKGHFKDDPNRSSSSLTSSSSEESLSKGLRFPDHTVVDGGAEVRDIPAQDPAATISNAFVTNQLKNIVGGWAIWLTGGGAPETTSKPSVLELHSDSSQESEFEFLDNE